MNSLNLFHKKINQGFTLFEILIACSVIVIICAAGIWISFDTYRQSSLRLDAKNLVYLMQKARSSALAQTSLPIGIHINDTEFVLFTGDHYDPQHESNEVIKRNDSLIIKGLRTIVFKPASAAPVESGSVILNFGNHEQRINVDSNGFIEAY